MTKARALLLITILWAVVYLPGLGSTEIKGEEGRRILPAVTMLETGNWLVPQLGGKPYLRKPPLMNWLIAGSFEATGVRNEWTARLPSAVAILALVVTIVSLGNRPGWLSTPASLLAAIFSMTAAGVLSKARFAGAEIEGVYVPLTGLAIVTWLAFWTQKRTAWLTWTIPLLFVGVAALAKGPSLHLLFFYAIVVAVVWRAKAWRELVHPAHFVGLSAAAAIFAAWAVPYFRAPETQEAAEVWKRQGLSRFVESEFDAGNYFSNLPRGLSDLLPWILLAPLVYAAVRKRPDRSAPPMISEASQRLGHAMRGTALASSICFIAVLLVPGALPRYVLPLAVPFAVVTGWAVESRASEALLRRWFLINRAIAGVLLLFAIASPIAAGMAEPLYGGFNLPAAVRAALFSTPVFAFAAWTFARRPVALSPAMLGIMSAALFGSAALVYTAGAVPWIVRKDNLRPMAKAIDSIVPHGERLVIYSPDYQPSIFYLRTPYIYAVDTADIPADAIWVLTRTERKNRLTRKHPDLQLEREFTYRGRAELALFRRSARQE